MKISLNENLIELAKKFKEKGSALYVVGGYVRNVLLNRFDTDIDLTGPSSIEEATDIASELGWRVQVVNKKLGTLLFSKKNDHYEYCCFRSENYNVGGAHSPSSVDFVKDIKIDAARRDFTVNALYYDIVEDEILDFYNSIEDLKKNRLVAIGNPERVFSSDGLRILRLVRQAGDLGFKVERNTLKKAIEMVHQLKDISKERVLYEMIRIACGDYYKMSIKTMNSLGAWRYITTLPFGFKLPINKIVKAIEVAPLEWKFELLLCAILYKKMRGDLNSFNNLSFHINQIVGESGMKASKKIMTRVRDLYHLIYIFIKNNAPLTSAQEYYLLRGELKPVFACLNKKRELGLSAFIDHCLDSDIPLTVDQLDLTSSEMIEKGITPKNINPIKKILVFNCLNGNLPNKSRELLKGAKKADRYLIEVEKNTPKYY